ncbi:MAG: phosphoadenylyl-sulfate reductase [Magnetovibrionaceae bacterium]
MPLLKSDGLVSDPWVALADDERPTAGANLLVPFERWQAEGQSLQAHDGELGLALPGDVDLEEIKDEIFRFKLITLSFPTFMDGRAYSAARLLRERFGFSGELRAVGDVLRDQVPLMARCGFDAFEVSDENADASWLGGVIERAYQPAADGRQPIPLKRREAEMSDAEKQAAELQEAYGSLDAKDLLEAMITREFAGRLALVSSFGAESAVLLHMISRIEPALPVVFLNTGKLFGETKSYRDRLLDELGLTGLREMKPDPADLEAEDADGVLWKADPDHCCHIRKVKPLARALAGIDAWITGRKAYHGGDRSNLPTFETEDGRIKINPLANWDQEKIKAYMDLHDLPAHPLVADGYLSIGCMPCTDKVKEGEDVRAGRWRGQDKTECGIHFSADGKPVRAA